MPELRVGFHARGRRGCTNGVKSQNAKLLTGLMADDLTLVTWTIRTWAGKPMPRLPAVGLAKAGGTGFLAREIVAVSRN
jgi:hypothetical protein